MDSADLREAYRAFTTPVALITTDGPKGPNVMAAEWTFNVSYEPFLVAVFVEPENVTHDAIAQSKEFGVNVVSDEQIDAMGFAGHYSKRDTDKLSSALFETYDATKIKAPLIRGCLMNAECRLVQQVTMGDHTAFVGEVVAFTVDPTKKPIILHRGPRHLGPRIERGISLVVVATPMVASPGATVIVEGEFNASDRGSKRIEISLRDEKGADLSRIGTETDSHGYFRAKLAIPTTSPPGLYGVHAQQGGTVGKARLRIG